MITKIINSTSANEITSINNIKRKKIKKIIYVGSLSLKN